MQYEALVFDFFGVICSEISPFWFEEHFAEKGDELRSQYMPQADRGHISQESLFAELSRLARVPADQIEKDWMSHVTFNIELIALIRELKSSYKIGLLSNAIVPFFYTVLALSGTLDLYDSVIVSSEVGYAKPEPEIYQIMLERLKVKPKGALMIDDNQANLYGAATVGMPGHLYTSVQELRDFLL